ncbi:MAG: hypothetical protein R3266_01855 [Gemmatimonadota bacterium]|nr:hypothetical protein [Gemmatimonadota bacterium]
MRAFREFMQGLAGLAPPVQIWVLALGAVNLIGGIVYVDRREGRMTLLALGVAFVIMLAIQRWRGFVRLLGLGHLVAWIPLLVWLALRFDELPRGGAMRGWVLGLFVMNGVSLVIDAADFLRYLRGERELMT